MVSRLYPTTQLLYRQIHTVLVRLSVNTLFSPTQFGVLCLYVSGLILLDRKQSNTRIALYLPARCHDALNRLLRVVPFSTRALLGVCATFVKGLGVTGYLSLDDVIVPKPFGKTLCWAARLWCPSEKRYVNGMQIVVLAWCWGRFKVPLTIRLWRPSQVTGKRHYRTKLKLAQEMLIDVRHTGVPFAYIVFDGWYTAGWFTKWLNKLHIQWVGKGRSNARIVYRNREMALCQIPPLLKLKWRSTLDMRAATARIYLPTFGQVRLVVTRDRHGKLDFILTNALHQDLCTIVLWKRSRWDIETLFRNSKQLAGLASCQCRAPQAVVRHVTLVFFTCFVLDLLKVDPSQTTDASQQHLQLQVITQGLQPPVPLQARTV
jgi:hypothetical protein